MAGKTLALIESVFQLKSILEVTHTEVAEVFIIARLSGNLRNDNEMLRILEKSGASYSCIKTRDTVFSRLRFILKVLSLAPRKRLFRTRVLIGDWRSAVLRFAGYLLYPTKLGLVDDGLATLTIVADLDEHYGQQRGLLWSIPSLRKILIRFQPVIYTRYDVSASYLNIVSVKESSATRGVKDIASGTLIIVGCPLVDKGMMSATDYIEAIKKGLGLIHDDFDDIQYFPHRAEDPNFVRSVTSKLSIGVTNIDESIESFFEKMDVLPTAVSSFYSSALINLAGDYPSVNFYSFKPLKSCFIGEVKAIDRVYNYIQNNPSIEVLNL